MSSQWKREKKERREAEIAKRKRRAATAGKDKKTQGVQAEGAGEREGKNGDREKTATGG